MPLVINRRGYDLARITTYRGKGEPHITNRDTRLAICQLFYVVAQAIQLRDKGVNLWQRISKAGKTIEDRL